MACENNRRKYRLIASQSANGRQLASSESLRAERQRLRTYDQRYCGRVGESKVAVKSLPSIDDNGN